jgi:hypothetical protein
MGTPTQTGHKDADKDGPTRAELDDAPPFLSWRAIYLIVLGALALEVVFGAALTWAAS